MKRKEDKILSSELRLELDARRLFQATWLSIEFSIAGITYRMAQMT